MTLLVFVFVLLYHANSIIVDLDQLPDDPQLMRMVPDNDNDGDGDDVFTMDIPQWISTPIPSVSQQSVSESDMSVEYQPHPLENYLQTIPSTFIQDDEVPPLFDFFQQTFQVLEEAEQLRVTLAQTVSELSPDDTGSKLNWDVFADALAGMLQNIQNARQVESETFERKEAIYTKIRNLHDRTESRLALDLARFNKRLSEQLEPSKKELSETLKYRVNTTLLYNQEEIFGQIKDSFRATEDEHATQRTNMKVELDEVSNAQSILDDMIKTFEEAKQAESSFVQVLQQQHTQLKDIMVKRNNDPIMELIQSLSEVLSTGFKERKAIKQAQDLLEKLRASIVDFKLELIDERTKQQSLYEDRRKALENDHNTNSEIYSSKLEQYNAMMEQTDQMKALIKDRGDDRSTNADAIDFFKRVWTSEQDTQVRLLNKLRGNAAGVNNAIQKVGKGIKFEGEMVWEPRNDEIIAEEDEY